MSSANAAAYQAGAASAAPGSPLDMLFQQFGQLEAQTLLQEFLSALSAGVNPRQIAQELSDTIDQLSYGRAETIMRTESLGAWNDAALENYRANSDIIGSWMWVCMPGAGTCVSCLEEDGTIYGLDEELDDHPFGRCVKGPVTNDYGSILSNYGIDASGEDFGPGPWDDRQTGEEWLLAQDAATQRASFGSNAAYNAWRSGDAKLADFVAVRHDAVWGDSIYQQSLKGMGLDARDYAAGKVAYAAEMPEIPGIRGAEPGNTMGYQIDDIGHGRAILDQMVGHNLTDDEIGHMLGAQKNDFIDITDTQNIVGKTQVRFTLHSSDWDPQAVNYNWRTPSDVQAMRTFFKDDAGELVMSNDFIKVAPAAQGKGLGARYFGEEVQNLSDMGVSRIVTGADGSAAQLALDPSKANGFYTWARFGYDTKLADLRDEGLDLEALHNAFPGVKTLQDLMVQPGGIEYWRANGVSFHGIFDLKEGSISRFRLDSYLEQKGIVLEPLEREATTTATREAESPAIQQLRADRSALQVQRDAIQAKQDVLSARWAKIVRETDFTEEDEAAAAEKKLAAIEKQQANNIAKMDKLDAKMAKIDAKLPEMPEIEPLAREAESPAIQQMRASLDALDPNAIHPTAADKFGLDLRNTYRVEVDGQPYFVKAEHAPMEMNGVRYDVEAQTMAADKVAQLMGMGDSVVPARFIENDAGRFIVQPWVGGTELSKLDETALKEAFANMPAADIQRQSLFGYLVGDSDRNAAGYFLMPDGSIKAVDFGGAFDVSSPGLVNNFMQIAVPGKDVANVAIDRTVAEDLLSHVAETKVALQQYGLDDAQLTLFDEQAAKLQAVLAQQENPAFYDLLSDHTYYTAPDRDALLTVGRSEVERAEEAVGRPFGTLDDIRASQKTVDNLYDIPIGNPTTMEKEHPEIAERGVAQMDQMITKLGSELRDNGAFMRLARRFDYSKDQADGWMVIYSNAKRAAETGRELDAETTALAAMTREEARVWADEKAMTDAIYTMLEEYHVAAPVAVGDITKWNGNNWQVAVLDAARQEFGLGNVAHDYYSAEQLAAAKGEYGTFRNGIGALLRQMQTDTQQFFADKGITDITLFRGLRWNEGEQPLDIAWSGGMTQNPITAQPLSSWASDAQVAFDYASGTGMSFFSEEPADYGMMLATKVPVDQVLSIGLTGFGATPLRETMLLAGDYPVYAIPFKASEDINLDAILQEMAGSPQVAQAADLTPEAAAAAAPALGAPLTYTLPEIDQQAEAALIQQIQDAIPDAGVASHTDAIDIGNTIDSYVQERIGPLQDYVDELNAIRAHPQDLTGDQIAWLHGDLSQHGGLTTNEVMQQYQAARRDETVRLLGQVRDVGGTDLELAGRAPAALEDAIRQAQEVFPTAWLDASNSDGAVKLVQEATRRGYYRADINGGDGTLALRANAGSTPDDLYTAAVHELGHRMEASVDGVWQMEQQFYDARTAGEPWKALDPSLRVVGRTKVDQWAQEYLGLDPKTIVRAGGLAPIQHYELLSSGLEWLLGADSSGAYWLSRDPEYRQFIYGILFGTRGAGGG